MSDSLSLLRNFVKNKKDFHEDDDKIIFGDLFYPKNVKTTYLIYGTGKDGRPKDYYTLECLAFLIKHRDLQHPMYVKNAGTRNISVVSRPDRRDLLSYLDGEVESTPSIDKNAPLEIAMQRPQTYVKQSSSSSSALTTSSAVSATMATVSSGLKRPAPTPQQSLQPMDIGDASAISRSGDLMTSGAFKEGTAAKVARIDTNEPFGAQLQQHQTIEPVSAKEQFIDRLSRKFDESAAQSQRAITDNIMPLSEQLTKEKIAALKAKKKAMQRNMVSVSGMDLDDDPLAQATGGQIQFGEKSGSGARGAATAADRLSTKLSTDYSGFGSSGIVGGVLSTSDESDAVIREISKREIVIKNRFSVLQSSGKQFEKEILAFLSSVKAKEEAGADSQQQQQSALNTSTQLQPGGTQVTQAQTQMSQAQQRQMGYNRFDQERYAAKDETGGFSIDTKLTYQPNGGALSLTPNPNASPNDAAQTASNNNKNSNNFTPNTQLAPQKTNIIASTGSNGANNNNNGGVNNKAKLFTSPNQPMQKRTNAKPIIIVPNTNTSLITLLNCIDILQDLKYVTSEEKRKSVQIQNAPKDCEIVMHRRDDGTSQQFKIIDNVNKLQSQDWNRVVAVFAQGKQWQFKEWPFGYGNPAEIFNKVKGFHLKMSGIPLDPNISKWSVTVIELDQHKRHLDRARLLTFWDELDKFMAKTKPYLCA